MCAKASTTDCILVVDDDQDIRETLVEILEEAGCGAVGVGDGQQAIDALEHQAANQHTCLILLDLMMPVMDGRTFRQEQLKRARLAGIPVAIISAFQDSLAEAKEAMTAVAALSKPLQIRDVMELAKAHCVCESSP